MVVNLVVNSKIIILLYTLIHSFLYFYNSFIYQIFDKAISFLSIFILLKIISICVTGPLISLYISFSKKMTFTLSPACTSWIILFKTAALSSERPLRSSFTCYISFSNSPYPFNPLKGRNCTARFTFCPFLLCIMASDHSISFPYCGLFK